MQDPDLRGGAIGRRDAGDVRERILALVDMQGVLKSLVSVSAARRGRTVPHASLTTYAAAKMGVL